MVNLLAGHQPTGVKDTASDQALVAKPSAKFLKAFSGAKGLSRRSEGPAPPCPALPCPHHNVLLYLYHTALPCPIQLIHFLPYPV